jgi:hypothetical protein
MEFLIKEGDRLPPLEVIVLDEEGFPIDLTGYTSVIFKMWDPRKGASIISSPAEVPDAPNGKVRYSWKSGDTSVPGLYFGEFKVLFGNQQLTFPNFDYIRIRILESI